MPVYGATGVGKSGITTGLFNYYRMKVVHEMKCSEQHPLENSRLYSTSCLSLH